MQILSVKMIIILKGFIKQPVTKESPTFPSFLFSQRVEQMSAFSLSLQKCL